MLSLSNIPSNANLGHPQWTCGSGVCHCTGACRRNNYSQDLQQQLAAQIAALSKPQRIVHDHDAI